MRLLPEEQVIISKLLEKYNLSDQYQLVKKRGWVHIQIDDKTFAFHRKKYSQLIQGQFEDQYQYFVRIDMQAKSVNGFSEVLNELAIWLNEFY
jgi:hypothetical protein